MNGIYVLVLVAAVGISAAVYSSAEATQYKFWLIANNVHLNAGQINVCVWSDTIIASKCQVMDLTSLFLEKKKSTFAAGYVAEDLNVKPVNMHICAETLQTKGPHHWFGGCPEIKAEGKFLVGRIDFATLDQNLPFIEKDTQEGTPMTGGCMNGVCD